jgi:lysozyme
MGRPLKARTAVTGLSLYALAFMALMGQKGWTDRAVILVKGNVPTIGPSLTKRADGSPVQLGDTIKPIEGVQRSLAQIQKDEQGIKACITVPLSQSEYDLMVDFSYQYGTAALCSSSPAATARWLAAGAAASERPARGATKPA